MAKEKVTQIQTIFYKLYKHHKSANRNDFIPIFEFMGEIFIEEIGKWGFMSYELPARFADIKRENPNLLEHKEVIGKSGAKYYSYRLNPNVTAEDIKDEKLFAFYQLIRSKK